MKLTFKDLKKQKFVIEAEPSETVGEIKAKISTEKGWEPGLQKLIYSGKILQDEKTVGSYNIEENGFIVCMVTKPKAPAAAPATSSSKAAPSTPAPSTTRTPAAPAPNAPSLTAAANAPDTPSPAPPAGTDLSATPRLDDPSALAMGSERQAAIDNMLSMGFPRTEIDAAMRAAFNNPERAVEYLLNGIPASASQPPPPSARSMPQAPATATGEAEGGLAAAVPATTGGDEPVNLFEAAAQAGHRPAGSPAGGAGGQEGGAAAAQGGAGALGNLDFLRNNPQFQQLRQVVHQQPQMLEPILQQVAQGNPGLARLITTHPDQFMELLSEEIDEDAPLPPGAQAISVTEEEREAIERLCRLGFERDLVIQAYFACDKDEELAANFLFDHDEEAQ